MTWVTSPSSRRLPPTTPFQKPSIGTTNGSSVPPAEFQAAGRIDDHFRSATAPASSYRADDSTIRRRSLLFDSSKSISHDSAFVRRDTNVLTFKDVSFTVSAGRSRIGFATAKPKTIISGVSGRVETGDVMAGK